MDNSKLEIKITWTICQASRVGGTYILAQLHIDYRLATTNN